MKTSHHLIYFFLISILLLSCSKDNIESIGEKIKEKKVNNAPENFEITVTHITDSSATIKWTEAVDLDSDPIIYKIYLNENLIKESIEDLKYDFINLSESKRYDVKIIAKDSYGNETSQLFSFTTKKYYLRYFKAFNYTSKTKTNSGSPYCMIKTDEGDYIIAGKSLRDDMDGYEFFALKTDYEGNEIWSKHYDFQLGDSYNFKMASTPDGFIVAARHHVINVDKEGNLLWHKEIKGSKIIEDSFQIKSVTLDFKGNIYLVGSAGISDRNIGQVAVLTKLKKSGEMLIEKIYQPSFMSTFDDLIITSSDELIILGSTETDGLSFEDYVIGSKRLQIDFWIVKSDVEGNILWEKTYGDARYDLPSQIISGNEDNFVFSGSSVGGYDISEGRIFNIRGNGDEIWNTSVSLNKVNSIAINQHNELIGVGYMDYRSQNELGALLFNQNGATVWERTHAEVFTYIRGQYVLAEKDGGFRIIASKSKLYDREEGNKLLVYKTDPEGYFE